MSIIIHGRGISPFVRKVLVALEEKGVAYEKVDAIPIPRTDHQAASSAYPRGTLSIIGGREA